MNDLNEETPFGVLKNYSAKNTTKKPIMYVSHCQPRPGNTKIQGTRHLSVIKKQGKGMIKLAIQKILSGQDGSTQPEAICIQFLHSDSRLA